MTYSISAHPCYDDDNPCGPNSNCEMALNGKVACVCKAGFTKINRTCVGKYNYPLLLITCKNYEDRIGACH